MKITLKRDDESQIVLYTDGSCYPNPGPGGWAVVTHVGSGMYTTVARGSDHLTTNIKMEGLAILAAMEYAATVGQMRLRGIVIRTDSEYWVKTLTEWAPKWEKAGWTRPSNGGIKNLELVKRLYALYKALETEISLEWVRGHNGEPGNEAADVAAGQARLDEVERITRLKENA